MKRLLVVLLLIASPVGATTYAKPDFELTPDEEIEDMFALSDAVVVGTIDPIESGRPPHICQWYVNVQHTMKGDVFKKRIPFDPANFMDMSNTPLNFWWENHGIVVLFLRDLDQYKLERKNPDSAATSWTHAWALLGRVPDYGVPVQNATPELLARLAALNGKHSIESLARESDLVVLGTRELGWGIKVERVIKGKATEGSLTARGKGFGVYPDPPSRALFFLQRIGSGFEVLHCSAGVKPVRGNRLRGDACSLEEAIARVQSASR